MKWQLALAFALTGGCAALTNLDDLRGGTDGSAPDASDAGTKSDVEPDVAPPQTCKSSNTACVEGAPPAWTGPFAIYFGASPAVPTCPSPMVDVLDGHQGVADASAACSPCGCGVTGASCGTPTVTFFNGSCATTCATDPSPTTCKALPIVTCGGFPFVKAPAPLASATCATDGGSPLGAMPSWQNTAFGCKEPQSALQQVDCAQGQVCAPLAPPGFETKLCVSKDGDVACDGPPYANKRVIYTQFSDGRGCGTCGCSTNGPATCDGGVRADAVSTCNGTTPVLVPFGTCGDTSNGGASQYYEVYSTPPLASAFTCTPSGGATTGTVTETQPVTVCCM